MLKNLVFYTVVGAIVAWIAQLVGLGMGTTLLLSLLLPPALILGYRILYYNR
ncbi:MAG: hypothetical protein HY676_06300 [Chloroflexi bacterium]|nr:hypothetical protein [Chloroflexota bacterium]